MKPLLMATAALVFAVLMAEFLYAEPDAGGAGDAYTLLTSAAGHKSTTGVAGDRSVQARAPKTRAIAAELDQYCIRLLKGQFSAALARKSSHHPRQCVDLVTPVWLAQAGVGAEPGQPDRGGDGGGIPGAPGGRGGESGVVGGRGGTSGGLLPADPAFVAYCVEMLQSRGRAVSRIFYPLDCAEYFIALERIVRRPSNSAERAGDGPDGPSIAGGTGGKGGKGGSGPGGGQGGAGGAGIGGGLGGAGGAGGANR